MALFCRSALNEEKQRNQDYGIADDIACSKVALSANGDTVLIRTSSGSIQVSQYTNSFTTIASLPSGSVIASDKLNNSIFYGLSCRFAFEGCVISNECKAASGLSFYLSTNGGQSFTATKGALGASTAPVKIVVNPGVTGDLWVSTDAGLFHSTDSGNTFTPISGISEAWAIALGAPATTSSYPAIFAAANINGVGYFRSDDEGVSWVQINDAKHGFGSASANVLSADPRIYGRYVIHTHQSTSF